MTNIFPIEPNLENVIVQEAMLDAKKVMDLQRDKDPKTVIVQLAMFVAKVGANFGRDKELKALLLIVHRKAFIGKASVVSKELKEWIAFFKGKLPIIARDASHYPLAPYKAPYIVKSFQVSCPMATIQIVQVKALLIVKYVQCPILM